MLNRPGKLAKVLLEAVGGLGPQAAREVAARAAGDPEAPATAANVLALVAALQALWEPLRTGRWQPGNLLAGEQIVGYAPYPAHGPHTFMPTATLSAAVAAYYAAAPGAGAHGGERGEGGGAARDGAALSAPGGVPADPYAQARANAAAALRRARQGIERRLAGLAADEPAPGAAQRLRTSAEWLLALASQVAPHQAVLEVPLVEGSLEIPLDPLMTPVEQAQRMFRRAAKLARAEVFIPQRRAELQGDLALVDQLSLDLQAAANQPEIAAVQAELRAAGLLGAQASPGAQASSPASSGRGAQQKQARTPALQGGLLRLRSPQGLEIVVGRNARQNERVTFGEAHPEDLWLHARGVPGSHTIIRTGGQVADEATVRAAAQLAAYHSARARRAGGGRDRHTQALGPARAGREGGAGAGQAGGAGGDGAGGGAGGSGGGRRRHGSRPDRHRGGSRHGAVARRAARPRATAPAGGRWCRGLAGSAGFTWAAVSSSGLP